MYSVQSGPKGRLLYGFLSYENIRYRGSFKPKCGKCLFFSVGSFVRSFTSPFLRFCFSSHLFYLSVLLYSLDSSSSISQFVIQSITTKHGRGLLWTRTKKPSLSQSLSQCYGRFSCLHENNNRPNRRRRAGKHKKEWKIWERKSIKSKSYEKFIKS